MQYKAMNMNLETLIDTLPPFAKDLKLNLSSLLRQTELNPQQAWGTLVASAVAARNPQLLRVAEADAAQHLSPQAMEAAKGAAAIMGMNNIYYRFLHLAENEKYRTIPARLRMNILRTHGVDAVDFELWSTAVSAINGCGSCVRAHEKVLREKGLPEESVLAAIRIAAVVHAIAVALEAGAVSSSELQTA
jgi:alkyl hydroperoxide reductase subunit D